MKTDVVKILANKEGLKPRDQYAKLLDEYRKEATAKQVWHFQLGYTPEKLENLIYELKRMFLISEKEIVLAFNGSKAKVSENNSLESDRAGKSAAEIAEMIKNHSDLKAKNAIVPSSNEVLLNLPDDAKEGLKIRDEYPFLNDSNTPDEYKVLVADKISAYKNYAMLHAQALGADENGEPDEALYLLAKDAMKEWTLNQEIKEELDFYRDSNGKILGKNPKLAELKQNQEVLEMTEAELVKARSNAQKSVSKYKDDPANLTKWKSRLQAIENRLVQSFKHDFQKPNTESSKP